MTKIKSKWYYSQKFDSTFALWVRVAPNLTQPSIETKMEFGHRVREEEMTEEGQESVAMEDVERVPMKSQPHISIHT